MIWATHFGGWGVPMLTDNGFVWSVSDEPRSLIRAWTRYGSGEGGGAGYPTWFHRHFLLQGLGGDNNIETKNRRGRPAIRF